MGFTLPESRTRRIDLLVATLMGAWIFGWFVVDLVSRAGITSPNSFSVGLVLVLLGGSSIQLPFLYGVAKGRRWGFAWMAGLSLLGCAGSFLVPLVANKPITPLGVIGGLVNAAMVVYCALRLRQEHRPGSAPVPRSTHLRLFDAFVGGGGASWVLVATWVIVRNSFRHPIRQAEWSLFSFLGFLALAYLIACLGVTLGRRWGFVSMIVFGVLVLMGEVPFLWVARLQPLPQEVGVVAFNGFAVLYGAFRLRRPVGRESPATLL